MKFNIKDLLFGKKPVVEPNPYPVNKVTTHVAAPEDPNPTPAQILAEMLTTLPMDSWELVREPNIYDCIINKKYPEIICYLGNNMGARLHINGTMIFGIGGGFCGYAEKVYYELCMKLKQAEKDKEDADIMDIISKLKSES